MKEILLVIKEYIIYLFTPNFSHDEELEYLRNLFTTERMECKRLTNLIIEMRDKVITESDDNEKIEAGSYNPQPVNRPNFIPWAVKQRMLEREDREKHKSLAKEAAEKVNIDKLNSASTIDELEHILGVE